MTWFGNLIRRFRAPVPSFLIPAVIGSILLATAMCTGCRYHRIRRVVALEGSDRPWNVPEGSFDVTLSTLEGAESSVKEPVPLALLDVHNGTCVFRDELTGKRLALREHESAMFGTSWLVRVCLVETSMKACRITIEPVVPLQVPMAPLSNRDAGM